MRSNLAGLRTLVLPWGTPSGQPRIIIGPDIPSYLTTIEGRHTIAALIWEVTSTQAHFYALIGPPFAICRGTYDDINGAKAFEQSLVNPTELTLTLGNLDTLGEAGYNIELSGANFLIGALAISGDPGDPAENPFTIDGVTVGRGLRDWEASDTASGAIGAEAVVTTSANVLWRDGRAYRVTMHAGTLASVNNVCTYRIRKTNLAGSELQVIMRDQLLATGATNSVIHEASCMLARASGDGDVRRAICLTLAASAGTCTVDGNVTRWLKIEDVGKSGDYPHAVLIT